MSATYQFICNSPVKTFFFSFFAHFALQSVHVIFNSLLRRRHACEQPPTLLLTVSTSVSDLAIVTVVARRHFVVLLVLVVPALAVLVELDACLLEDCFDLDGLTGCVNFLAVFYLEVVARNERRADKQCERFADAFLGAAVVLAQLHQDRLQPFVALHSAAELVHESLSWAYWSVSCPKPARPLENNMEQAYVVSGAQAVDGRDNVLCRVPIKVHQLLGNRLQSLD
jgi:hypothetical protein